LNSFFDLLYPSKCAICRGLDDQSPCERCRSKLIRENFCFSAPVAYIDEVRAVYRYSETALYVKALKFHRETSLVEFMSEEIARIFNNHYDEMDAIIPVPIHRSRLCWRGFNQAQLLCEKLPANLVKSLRLKIRRTPPQARLDPEARIKNLEGAFRCDESVYGKRILLIDDVYTSGSTASECARALKAAGASYVAMIVFAATPYTVSS
jgi:ComF family protein